jgi:hypothetical protein
MKKTTTFLLYLALLLMLLFAKGKKFPIGNIDHSNPDIYAKPTRETQLSKDTIEKLKGKFPQPNNLNKIGLIYQWVKRNFTGKPAGGKLIARRSAQEIFDSRMISGCNDSGILKTAILRAFNYPVVFMNAASINWAKRYRKGQRGSSYGHVFLEIYIKSMNRWIVMDSVTSEYIEDYDFNDPVIPIPKSRIKEKAYFVYHKGKDHWTMGVFSKKDNAKDMRKFASTYPLKTIIIKPKEIKRLMKRERRLKR